MRPLARVMALWCAMTVTAYAASADQFSPRRILPGGTPGPIDLTRFSGTCRTDLVGQSVTVTLTVTNSTGGLLRGVLPGLPAIQIEAGTAFALGRVPQPRSYPTLATGSSVVFRWTGTLTSSGAVGISASASATGPNNEIVNTPLVDCGTIGSGVPPTAPPTVPPTATKPAGQTPTAILPTKTATPIPQPTQPDDEEAMIAFIISKWSGSGHAATYGTDQGNTYCAKCHSPFQAVASASATTNQPVPIAVWQHVTCAACHPPEAQRDAWKTPIGTYNVATKSYSPVPIYDADVLCTYCHTGQFAQIFQNFGQIMHDGAVRCIDCHMAMIPGPDPAGGKLPTHDLKVAANLPYSCGTVPGGCHSRRPASWAARILTLSPIHPK